jgi:hypothetical protein
MPISRNNSNFLFCPHLSSLFPPLRQVAPPAQKFVDERALLDTALKSENGQRWAMFSLRTWRLLLNHCPSSRSHESSAPPSSSPDNWSNLVRTLPRPGIHGHFNRLDPQHILAMLNLTIFNMTQPSHAESNIFYRNTSQPCAIRRV